MIRFRYPVALRLALICGGLVIAATVLLSTVFYFGTVGILDRKADRKILATTERLVETAAHNDWPTVSKQIEQDLGDGVDSDSEIYLIRDADGRAIAGNISAWTDATAPVGQIIDHLVVRKGRSFVARLLLHRFADGTLLVVGRDMSDLAEIGGLIGSAIWTGGLLALLLSIGGTVLFHRKIERRIGAIRHTARDIQFGNLSQRIKTSDKTDEFDRLGADINSMLDRIEMLMDGVRNVSNMVAHNVRTPLGRIRGRLEEVLRGKSDTRGLEAAGTYAIEQIDGLIALLDKLLQISEAESGTRRQPFALVNLSDVITPVMELYDAAAEAQGITLRAHIEGTPVILGDKDLLASLLANLLDNALKHARNSATIEVKAIRDEQGLNLVVQDRGPGIPLSEREKVLRRFYRLDGRGQGNGLGLSIVAALTSLHGGAVFLEDAEPGLRVRITFPMAAETLPNGNVLTPSQTTGQ
jgi:signal transduction histidine kinase